MADIILNPEKTASTQAVSHSFSPAQSEGYASGSAFKVAESTASLLPLFVICPDGNVAGTATTKAEIVKLNGQCREKG
jgi:hypothetical protein